MSLYSSIVLYEKESKFTAPAQGSNAVRCCNLQCCPALPISPPSLSLLRVRSIFGLPLPNVCASFGRARAAGRFDPNSAVQGRKAAWRLKATGRTVHQQKKREKRQQHQKNEIKKNTHTQEELDCATCIRCRGRKNSFRFLFGFFSPVPLSTCVCVCVCEGFSVPLFWGSRLPIMQPGWGRRSKNRECIIPRWCIGPCAMGGCSFFLFFCCASCPFDRLVRMHILLHLLAVSVFDGSGPDGVVFQPGPGPVLPRLVLFGVRSFSFFFFFFAGVVVLLLLHFKRQTTCHGWQCPTTGMGSTVEQRGVRNKKRAFLVAQSV